MRVKVNLANLYEPALHYNPATGRDEYVWRVRHNDVRSPRLKRLDRCVAEATRGHQHRGHGAVADERETRRALAEAARACAKKGRR